jgi:hypothetical protein
VQSRVLTAMAKEFALRHQDRRCRTRWFDVFGLKPAAAARRCLSVAREQLGLGVVVLNLICNPVEAYLALDSLTSVFPENAQARIFDRPAANGWLPPADAQRAASLFLSLGRSVSRAPLSLRMESAFPLFSNVVDTMLRQAWARIAEHFYQRLAPTLEDPLPGDTASSRGIGVRLAADTAPPWIIRPSSPTLEAHAVRVQCLLRS